MKFIKKWRKSIWDAPSFIILLGRFSEKTFHILSQIFDWTEFAKQMLQIKKLTHHLWLFPHHNCPNDQSIQPKCKLTFVWSRHLWTIQLCMIHHAPSPAIWWQQWNIFNQITVYCSVFQRLQCLLKGCWLAIGAKGR